MVVPEGKDVQSSFEESDINFRVVRCPFMSLLNMMKESSIYSKRYVQNEYKYTRQVLIGYLKISIS